MQSTHIKTWDIFCRVIDNFGDIGVCWRLARQLVEEHQQAVRLWVDDLDSLIRIWPETRQVDHQQVAGVEVCRWNPEFSADVQIADVVVEGFACDIPSLYLDKMAQLKRLGQTPVWINLDYLSAESWVEEFHRMPSAHPATGLRKIFFFPGFTPRTGGLLREQSLPSARDGFHAAPWLASMGIEPQPNALLVSLFAYENPAVASLLTAWTNSSKPVHCLIPNGKILTSINQTLGQKLDVGDSYMQGNLYLQVIPFITQTEYDKLLWACDINFVRGEDSFVRAQWAGKPMLWHIYPQDEEVHITKLNAFLDLYTDQTAPALKTALHQSWLAWNQGGDVEDAWHQLMQQLNDWQQHSRHWCDSLLEQPDLTSQLVDFCTSRPS
ncbi:MAG: elongation factor P maturation arginine rhamnosyltransferase EarP [Cellvibrio sp.]|uniref:elongation factor P maturation arginine rhamnosyltransferase EarP n=1 Tax=Cellvibrio sp. TaxID=1965322 RepID=UPI00271A4617|nr:elongation factor P maturation arginine rhamnosyltransferase EarP [Cellvibrio sp.]